MRGQLVLALVPLFALAAVVGLLVYRRARLRRLPDYLAVIEYWVYTEQEAMPDQKELMDRVTRRNPHNRPGRPAVAPREAILFSDIRLHLGLAKRGRNPHIFRPDVLDEDVVPSLPILERLARAKAMVKVRYLSEAPLADTRHLVFVPHLAEAVSGLAQGTVVFDRVSDMLWTGEEFRALVAEDPAFERPSFHVRVVWKHTPEGPVVRTAGLRKVGRPELVTEPQDADMETLMTSLVQWVAHHVLANPEDMGPYFHEEFGDTFVMSLGEKTKGDQVLHVARHQVKP